MTPRKNFSDFYRSSRDEINEDVVSKAYALLQNSKHDAVSQKIQSTCSKIESIVKQASAERDVDEKLSLLLNALYEFSQVARLQSYQSTLVKNVAVASTILADDLNKTLEKHLSRLNLSRR